MGSSLAAAARRMGSRILDLRHETERDRRLPPKIVEDLVGSGLCRMGLPRAQSGLDATPVEWLEALEVLAGFEASVPWIVWNNGLVGFFARFLDEPVRAALFADADALTAQSTRPMGTAEVEGDGFRVSGRWSLVSGCELAGRLFLNCRVVEDGAPLVGPDGEPETRFAFVERGDVEILDTWHVGGLRGSGSHDVGVQGALVPRAHTVTPADGSQLDAPIGRVPIMATLVAGFAAQALGVARCALDTVVEMGRTRVTPGPLPDLRDRPRAQEDVARHGAALDASRDHLQRCVAALWARAGMPGKPDPGEIARSMAAALHADDVALRAVDTMVAAAGTSALYVDSPLERAQRDLHAMMRHVAAQPTWLEDAGRVAFGLPPESPQFLV